MAETKRTDIEIERDRHEIAELALRGLPHWKIADILNQRRRDEYNKAVKEAAEQIKDSDLIPAIMPPYELTRQMVSYDIKAIKAQWRKDSSLKLDEFLAEQLAAAKALRAYAWEQLRRGEGTIESLSRSISEIELKGEYPQGAAVRIPAQKFTEARKLDELVPDPRWGKIIDSCDERIKELTGLTL